MPTACLHQLQKNYLALKTVIMSSTGVIAVQLPIEKVEAGLVGMKADLCSDPLVGAKGIMTTDTYPKAISISWIIILYSCGQRFRND